MSTENTVFENNTLTLEERLKAIILSHRAAIKVSLMMSAATLMLVILVGVLVFTKTTDVKYFATTADGRIFRLMPLSNPIESDQAIEAFAGRALTNTFTFDYVNYQKQMADVAESYTSDAFTQIKLSLEKKGGIVSEAVNNKWVVTGNLMAAPQLIHKGLVPNTDTYGWRMRFPLLITYQSEEKTSSARYYADITVVRVDQRNNLRGIEIANLQLVSMG